MKQWWTIKELSQLTSIRDATMRKIVRKTMKPLYVQNDGVGNERHYIVHRSEVRILLKKMQLYDLIPWCARRLMGIE